MNLDNIIAKRPNKTIYRDKDVAIKVFSSDYSKSDVLKEALNHARVEETGLDMPKMLKVTSIDDKWAICYEFIEGETLIDLMHNNPEKLDDYLEQFVALQLKIHSKEAPNLIRLKDRLSKRIAKTPFDATTRFDLYSRLDEMPKHNKICHLDFDPSNIIVKDGKLFVIDWSHTAKGNAAADAALTYILFILDNEMEYARKYLELFCEKTNTDKEYLKKWIPIVAAAQIIIADEKYHKLLNALASGMNVDDLFEGEK